MNRILQGHLLPQPGQRVALLASIPHCHLLQVTALHPPRSLPLLPAQFPPAHHATPAPPVKFLHSRLVCGVVNATLQFVQPHQFDHTLQFVQSLQSILLLLSICLIPSR